MSKFAHSQHCRSGNMIQYGVGRAPTLGKNKKSQPVLWVRMTIDKALLGNVLDKIKVTEKRKIHRAGLKGGLYARKNGGHLHQNQGSII